jgi:hypothetical protein
MRRSTEAKVRKRRNMPANLLHFAPKKKENK